MKREIKKYLYQQYLKCSSHTISEKHGTFNSYNLFVQCSYCNKSNGSKNINYIDKKCYYDRFILLLKNLDFF